MTHEQFESEWPAMVAFHECRAIQQCRDEKGNENWYDTDNPTWGIGWKHRVNNFTKRNPSRLRWEEFSS